MATSGLCTMDGAIVGKIADKSLRAKDIRDRAKGDAQ
jgi:hypothetical protein